MRRVALAGALSAVVVLALGPAHAGSDISFSSAENHPTGSAYGPGPGATTTVALDADEDLDLDVVITDWFGQGPLVLLNDGTGRFGAPVSIAGAGNVGALGSGDLNEDGHTDLVGRDTSGVVVMLANGDGSFRVSGRTALSGNAQQSIAVTDVNADGRVDVATPERDGVRVLFGSGDGTLAAGPLSPLVGLLSDIEPADLEGDGKVDLLVADATPLRQRIVALRGSGDGRFTESGSGVVGYGPEAVMGGDLDGDGRADAVSVDSFSAFNSPPRFSITVLLGDGAGAFRSATTLVTGNGPVSGALGDFNNDRVLDIAVSAVGSSIVTIYRGNGAGGFTEVLRPSVARQPQTPVAADFDGDQRVDLVVPGVGSMSVLRNTGPFPSDAT